MYLHCNCSCRERNSTSRDIDSPARDWIDTKFSRSPYENRRQAESLGYASGGGGERKGVKRREIPPTFSRVTISSHLSAALADAGRESQFEETCSIRHRPTCLKKSHVFSLNARFYPLSDNLSPPSPFSLSLSCPVPPLLSRFTFSQPVPSRLFSTPLATWLFQTSSDFMDPSRRRYRWIVSKFQRCDWISGEIAAAASSIFRSFDLSMECRLPLETRILLGKQDWHLNKLVSRTGKLVTSILFPTTAEIFDEIIIALKLTAHRWNSIENL